MTRILLLGADGLLGSHLHKILKAKADIELIATSRKSSSEAQFDYRLVGLGSLLKRHRPDVVINCIAITSNKSSVRSLFMTNGVLPVHLAILGFKTKIRIVHISSNAVFSGTCDVNSENSLPIPRSKYGFSKLIGDLSMVGALVIRTSFVGMSSDPRVKRGLLDDLKHLPMNSSFKIPENFIWNGVTAGALSEFIYTVLAFKDFPKGIIHLGTSEKLSRSQLIEMLLLHLGRTDVSISLTPRESNRNMTLESRNSELISQIWSASRFGANPTILEMIREIPFAN